MSRKVHTLYQELLDLDGHKLIENNESFMCVVCQTLCEPKAGVRLTECIHLICKKCITKIVKSTNAVEIKCPYKDAEYICGMIIPHHEIKEIVSPKDYDIFIQRSIIVATYGKPVATYGKPVATDEKPVATDKKPVVTAGKPVATDGNPVNTYLFFYYFIVNALLRLVQLFRYAINGGDRTGSGSLYQNLVALNEDNSVETTESFICVACQTECEPKAGIILTECIHSICRKCIKKIVETTDAVEIICPFRDLEYACDTIIPHHKIKEICGTVIFEKFLNRSLASCIDAEPRHRNLEKEKRAIDTALYKELKDLDDQDLVVNQKAFICGVCLEECKPTAGVIIVECLHEFCKQCIAELVKTTTDVEIQCPYQDNQYSCENIILQHEIKQIVSQEVFDKYLEKSFSIGIRGVRDARNCQYPDCKGWVCIEDDGNDTFICPICKKINCLLCKGQHDRRVINCEQYKKTIINPNQHSEELLRGMVNKGEAMLCPSPSCGVAIQKVDGCDAVECSRCKIKICWATKGARWGPKGVGDTSGGCRCGVNGKKCHPNCKYCH